MYQLKRIDAEDESDTLLELNKACFTCGEYIPKFTRGWWWIAYNNFDPVAFCGLTKDPAYHPIKGAQDVGYLVRSGVRKDHRGHGLQLRLIRVREKKARELGLQWMVSDTSDGNMASANTLINAGYKLFKPPRKWAFKNGLYWKKELQ